jgi:hypothetical protein
MYKVIKITRKIIIKNVNLKYISIELFENYNFELRETYIIFMFE